MKSDNEWQTAKTIADDLGVTPGAVTYAERNNGLVAGQHVESRLVTLADRARLDLTSQARRLYRLVPKLSQVEIDDLLADLAGSEVRIEELERDLSDAQDFIARLQGKQGPTFITTSSYAESAAYAELAEANARIKALEAATKTKNTVDIYCPHCRGFFGSAAPGVYGSNDAQCADWDGYGNGDCGASFYLEATDDGYRTHKVNPFREVKRLHEKLKQERADHFETRRELSCSSSYILELECERDEALSEASGRNLRGLAIRAFSDGLARVLEVVR